jgi:hypothetical protein
MKKLFLILSIIILYINGFGQSVVQRANSTITVNDPRGMNSLNLFIPRYSDTTAANVQKGIDSLGAIIYTYDVQSYWGRTIASGSTKKWSSLGSGGGGGSGTVTNIATGLGLSGGPITTTGTILVDTADASILSRQRAAATFAPISITGTVTSVATGLGLSGGTITGSGTLLVDTSSASILSRQRAAATYALIGSNVASQGLLKSGDTTVFAGPFGTPGIFTNDRTLNTNRNIMNWTNGVPAVTGGVNWQFSKQAYSPFQFISQDTVTTNNEGLSNNRPLTGLFARRTLYFSPSTYRVNESYGQYVGQTLNFQDSIAIQTLGGDFMQAVIAELRIKPRGTGRQVAATGTSALLNSRRQEGVAALVANWYNDGDGTNKFYLRGTGVAFRPYLVSFTGAADTLENFVYVSPGNLVGGTGTSIRKSFLFAPDVGYGFVDSAFGWFDTARVVRSFHAGNFLIGNGDSTVTGDKFAVNGISTFNGVTRYRSNIAANYTPRSFTDKNYVDSALASFTPTTPGIDDVLAVGQDLTANRSINIAANNLSINNGVRKFIEIEGGAGSQFVNIDVDNGSTAESYLFLNANTSLCDFALSSHPQDSTQIVIYGDGITGVGRMTALNPTDGTNVSQVDILSTDVIAQWKIYSNFNNVTKTTEIIGLADASNSIITHTADAHRFNIVSGGGFVVNDGSADLINIDGSGGGSTIQSANTTGGGNLSKHHAGTSSSDAQFVSEANFNDGAKVANITGYADVSTATLTYTADSHNFAGNVLPTTDDTYTLGDDTHRWADIFLGPASIHIGTSTSDEGLLSYNTSTNVLALTSTGAISVNKVTITAPATSSTLTVADGSSLITSGAFALTLTSTATSNATIPAGTNTLYSTLSGSITSSQLATSLTNETGSGVAVFGTSPTFTTSILLAGATSGNITLNSDALSNALNGTTLSGAGYVPSVMFAIQKASNSMSDVNTAQDVFASDRNTWTFQPSTTYFFRGFYSLAHGATSHSVGMSFATGGAGSISAIAYTAIANPTAANTTTATQTMTFVNQTSNTAVNQAGANNTENIYFSGWLTTGSGGTVTFTPQITFSAAPGGAPTAAIGTYIEFIAIGTDAVTTLGNVN